MRSLLLTACTCLLSIQAAAATAAAAAANAGVGNAGVNDDGVGNDRLIALHVYPPINNADVFMLELKPMPDIPADADTNADTIADTDAPANIDTNIDTNADADTIADTDTPTDIDTNAPTPLLHFGIDVFPVPNGADIEAASFTGGPPDAVVECTLFTGRVGLRDGVWDLVGDADGDGDGDGDEGADGNDGNDGLGRRVTFRYGDTVEMQGATGYYCAAMFYGSERRGGGG